MSNGPISQVDIAICTWNRCELLAQTLKSFSELIIPESVQLQVLVVDNHSTDRTPEVIRNFQSTAFAQRCSVVSLTEHQQGHTFSRNRAIGSATGDLILWTDDDVIVDSGWIEKYVSAANNSPNHSFWGSVIEPRFPSGMPQWIERNWEILRGCFAHRDLGEEQLEFTDSKLPYGANFAIRTSVQKEFAFDFELGRRGDEVLGEDELDLMRRMIAAGHCGHWIPGATVEHVIPPERATEQYVYDYFVGQGQALVAKGDPWHTDSDKMKREAASEKTKYRLKRRLSSSQSWVSHLIRSALAQGQFEALRL